MAKALGLSRRELYQRAMALRARPSGAAGASQVHAGARGRAATRRAGRRAEVLAAAWPMAKGYRTLGFRLKRRQAGDRTFLAVRGQVLAAVEVKRRTSLLGGAWRPSPSTSASGCAVRGPGVGGGPAGARRVRRFASTS